MARDGDALTRSSLVRNAIQDHSRCSLVKVSLSYVIQPLVVDSFLQKSPTSPKNGGLIKPIIGTWILCHLLVPLACLLARLTCCTLLPLPVRYTVLHEWDFSKGWFFCHDDSQNWQSSVSGFRKLIELLFSPPRCNRPLADHGCALARILQVAIWPLLWTCALGRPSPST